jgi:hypothetical protein
LYKKYLFHSQKELTLELKMVIQYLMKSGLILG